MTTAELLKKYDVQAPRYTSYPTVPYWSETPSTSQWLSSLSAAFAKQQMSWSLYVHIPFCEALCTFCGCNTTITRNHDVETGYIELLLREFDLYHSHLPALKTAPLKQIHYGGGTPTFFSVQGLRQLTEKLFQKVQRTSDFEGSLEVDPRHTTVEQLQSLRDFGFQRVSMGVQDFDPDVQRLVHRVQPFDITKNLTESARRLGFESVNFDLIYGLPRQTPQTFVQTAEKTIELRPDRIALYSFARVPWIKPAQRLFKDQDIPEGDAKRALYEVAYELLTKAGYVEIGMDHFALKTDALYQAHSQKRLHRNFMGYTDQRTDVLMGLGVSSISESPTCFHQNEKVLPVYERRIRNGEIATFRGHLLNKEDCEQREMILKFMTEMQVDLPSGTVADDVRQYLQSLIDDGLVQINGRQLLLTPSGRPFLRNACMALDLRLRRSKPQQKVFSRAM